MVNQKWRKATTVLCLLCLSGVLAASEDANWSYDENGLPSQSKKPINGYPNQLMRYLYMNMYRNYYPKRIPGIITRSYSSPFNNWSERRMGWEFLGKRSDSLINIKDKENFDDSNLVNDESMHYDNKNIENKLRKDHRFYLSDEERSSNDAINPSGNPVDLMKYLGVLKANSENGNSKNHQSFDIFPAALKLQKSYIGNNDHYMYDKKAAGSEFLGKRVAGSEFLGKRAAGSEFLGKRVAGSEFLGKRAAGSEFLGKRAAGSEFLGKRAAGSEFLGKRVAGSEFLGKRVPEIEFLDKNFNVPDNQKLNDEETQVLPHLENDS